MSFEEYADLAGTGFQGGGKEQVAPEDESFHSVYIAGTRRKNHINITEEPGKLQVRGVEYNLDEVNMIITHTKEVLCNSKTERGKDSIVCFSYKDGAPPWNGSANLPNGEKRVCPNTSAERALVDFCNPCRAQIIVAGIYCKADGTPILAEDNKPIFIFIRGKATKYPNVSTYLSDCFNEDYPPIFTPVTEESKDFEKRVVNNKRTVTKIVKGTTTTQHGNSVNVFVLEKGTMIPNDGVIKILQLSKKTVEKFNEKFDWSKNKTSGYGKTAPEGVMTVDEPGEEASSEKPSSEAGGGKTFSFNDINW